MFSGIIDMLPESLPKRFFHNYFHVSWYFYNALNNYIVKKRITLTF